MPTPKVNYEISNIIIKVFKNHTENDAPDDLNTDGNFIASGAIDTFAGEVDNVSNQNAKGDHDLVT
jgi:hypothetical protein